MESITTLGMNLLKLKLDGKSEKYCKEKLYCYSKPNVMTEHEYSDDVALCYASNVDGAIDKFKELYDASLLDGNVREVSFNSYGIFIATNY